MGASLYDFRDLDLMLAIADSGDGLTAAEMAEQIGLGEEGTQAAAIRLSWMRRYGMVKFNDQHRLWTLSSEWPARHRGEAKGGRAQAIDAVPDESLVDVMAHVTTRYIHGDAMTANLLRREFLYGTGQRRNGNGRR